MGHERMIRTYVERLLSEGYDRPVHPEADGTFQLPTDAPVSVTVEYTGSLAPRVAVRAAVLEDVDFGLELAENLNEVNAGLEYGRVWWRNGQVFCESAVVAETVDHDQLGNAVREIVWLTAWLGSELADRVGGTVPQPRQPQSTAPTGEASEQPEDRTAGLITEPPDPLAPQGPAGADAEGAHLVPGYL